MMPYICAGTGRAICTAQLFTQQLKYRRFVSSEILWEESPSSGGRKLVQDDYNSPVNSPRGFARVYK